VRGLSTQKKKSSSSSFLTDEKFALMLVIPIIVFELVLVAYPLSYSFWLSLNNIMYVHRSITFVGPSNYIAVILDPGFLGYLVTTLRMTFDITVLVILGGLGIALLLNETFKGRTLLRMLVLLPWAVSEYCTAVIWRYLYSENLGFFNSFLLATGIVKENFVILTPQWAPEFLSIAYAWHYTPLIVFFILAGLQTVPEDLYRAARVDGAGAIKRFQKITYPHIRYAIIISLLLASMSAAIVTDSVILLTGGGPGIATSSLTWHIYELTFRDMEVGMGAAYSYILLVIMFILGTSYFQLLFRKRG
jgi:ABC-type sugar transport system permease subunit